MLVGDSFAYDLIGAFNEFKSDDTYFSIAITLGCSLSPRFSNNQNCTDLVNYIGSQSLSFTDVIIVLDFEGYYRVYGTNYFNDFVSLIKDISDIANVHILPFRPTFNRNPNVLLLYPHLEINDLSDISIYNQLQLLFDDSNSVNFYNFSNFKNHPYFNEFYRDPGHFNSLGSKSYLNNLINSNKHFLQDF